MLIRDATSHNVLIDALVQVTSQVDISSPSNNWQMLFSKSKPEKPEKTRKRGKYTSLLKRNNRVIDRNENHHKTTTIQQVAHQGTRQQRHTPDMKAQTLDRSMLQLSLSRLTSESEATTCRMLSAYYKTSKAHLQARLLRLTPQKR